MAIMSKLICDFTCTGCELNETWDDRNKCDMVEAFGVLIKVRKV